MRPIQRWALPVVLLLGWLAVAAYVWSFLDRGWYPHDEGTLGYTADRLLAGELPHLDFEHVYTGGLGVLNALTFRVLGTDAFHLRFPLFLCFLAWLPSFYLVSRRFAGSAVAALATAVAASLTLPNYAAAIPSWYTLFASVFAIHLAVIGLERDRRAWLLAAGGVAGLAVLMKVTGLYLLAGLLLGVALAEQRRARAAANDPDAAPRLPRSWSYTAALLTGVALLALLVVRTIGPTLSVSSAYQYLLPIAAPLALLSVGEVGKGRGSAGERWSWSLVRAGTLLLGFLAVTSVWMVLYLARGGLEPLLHALFVAPRSRLEFAAVPAPSPIWAMVAALPILVVYAERHAGSASARTVHLTVLGIGLAACVAAAHWDPGFYRLLWNGLRALPPLLALALAARIALDNASEPAALVVLPVAAIAVLTQFPFSAGVYFLYVSPLFVLVTLAAIEDAGRTFRRGTAFLCALLAFMVFYVNGAPADIGWRPRQPVEWTSLGLERSSIRVPPGDQRSYGALIPLLRERAPNGRVFAAPDAPEVYFLGGFRNPTGAMYDFFSPESQDSEALLARIEREGVEAVAIKLSPPFSPPLPEAVVEGLRDRFPETRPLPGFEVRWR